MGLSSFEATGTRQRRFGFTLAWITLFIEIILFVFRKHIHDYKKISKNVKNILTSIPIVAIIVLESFFGLYRLDTRGLALLPNKQSEVVVNNALFILGSYSIILVLAQDIGWETGANHKKISQSFLFFLAVGAGFALTTNRGQSVIAAILYFHLRFIWQE